MRPGFWRSELHIAAMLCRRLVGTGLCLLALSAPLTSAACAKGIPVIGPTISCVSTIVADALKGETLEQILQDAGPTCVTSIDQIIAILVGEAGRNPMVRDTVAYRDARVSMWLKGGGQ